MNLQFDMSKLQVRAPSQPDMKPLPGTGLHLAGFALVLCLLSACQSPFLTLAGEALTGEEAQTSDWRFASEYQILQLETRPDDPYSVNLRVTVIDDQLYVDAAQHRRWHTHIKEDPRVRVKLGDYVYPGIARQIDDSEILEQFLPGRTVYRIDPVPY